jgi:hypothetical protein
MTVTTLFNSESLVVSAGRLSASSRKFEIEVDKSSYFAQGLDPVLGQIPLAGRLVSGARFDSKGLAGRARHTLSKAEL